ncbi:hypothetical protein D3C72_1288290 [compost metagenome]
MILRVSKERQHITMAVDDTGRGRCQGCDAGERGFERDCLPLIDQLKVVAAVGFAFFAEGGEHGRLLIARGDDEFAAAAI